MIENNSYKKLCHIGENITDFEFRTSDALQLKQEIRQWYYGGRDIGEADKLIKRFDGLFPGNMFLDESADLLWTLVEQSPLELESPLTGIPRRQIIGRSIRAYGITSGRIQYQFKKWQTDADKDIGNALDIISRHLQRECAWRKDNRMSLFSALVSLAGIAALVTGVLFLIPTVQALLRSHSLYDMVSMYPSSWEWNPGTSFVFLTLFTLATGILLFLLPRMFMTLCAGLFWILYYKGRFDLRRKRLNQFQKAMREEGFGGYSEKLQTAAQQLEGLPSDAPQSCDPSRALLGQAGMDKVFRHFSLKPLSKGRSYERFYKEVEKRHVHSRAWIVILCTAVTILRDLLLTGSITAYLEGLL